MPKKLVVAGISEQAATKVGQANRIIAQIKQARESVAALESRLAKLMGLEAAPAAPAAKKAKRGRKRRAVKPVVVALKPFMAPKFAPLPAPVVVKAKPVVIKAKPVVVKAKPAAKGAKKVRKASLRDSMVDILAKAGKPMRIAEILAALKSQGVKMKSKKPEKSLSVQLYQNKKVFQRAGPGAFRLSK